MSAANTRLSVMVALALMVLAAGCAGLVSDDVDDIEEDELEEKTLDAMADVETFSMEYYQSVVIAGFSSEATVEGVMDLEARQAQLTTTLDDLPGEELEQYIIGGTLYQEVFGEWVKMEFPEESVWEQDETAQQGDALELGDIEILNTTTFEGHDVYVVDIELDEDDIEDVVDDPDAGMGGDFEDGFGGSEDVMEEYEFGAVNVTQYIDVETYHIRYVEMDFEMETPMGPATMGIEMAFSDFNEEVDIELPPEAEDAIDFEEWVWGSGNEFADVRGSGPSEWQSSWTDDSEERDGY